METCEQIQGPLFQDRWLGPSELVGCRIVSVRFIGEDKSVKRGLARWPCVFGAEKRKDRVTLILGIRHASINETKGTTPDDECDDTGQLRALF